MVDQDCDVDEEKKMGFGRIVEQNSDKKKMGVQYRLYLIVDQDCDVDKEKKMGFGRIVDQNSDEKKMGVQYQLN